MRELSCRVAIVGGGIGGLAAANALVRKGLEVQVYEQAAELGEVGAGVQIAPNAMRLLERMGLGERLRAVGVRFQAGSQYYRMDGTVVAPAVTTDSSGSTGVYGFHRADLLSVLADALPEGTVHTGHKCVAFEQDRQRARLTFELGAQADADAVIAADGIHSLLRAEVTPPSLPVHSGSLAYRGLVPADTLPSWPRDAWEMWMGMGKHFLAFPVRSGAVINYVGFVPSGDQMQESWSAPGDRARLAREFQGWDPRVEELLSKVDSTFWWGLYDREPLRRWTKGRLTLLGDAAHPMLPHLGQGANQSVEDGAALAVILGEGGREDAPRALRVYEQLRMARTKEVQLGSRANGVRYDSRYRDLERRDAELAAAATFRWWLYDYDAEVATAQALADR